MKKALLFYILLFAISTNATATNNKVTLKTVKGYWTSVLSGNSDKTSKLTLIAYPMKRQPGRDKATIVYEVQNKGKSRSCEFRMWRDMNESAYVFTFDNKKPRPKSKALKNCGSPEKIYLTVIEQKKLEATIQLASGDRYNLKLRPASPTAAITYDGTPAKVTSVAVKSTSSDKAVKKKKKHSVSRKPGQDPAYSHLKKYCQEMDIHNADSVFNCMSNIKVGKNSKSNFYNNMKKSSCSSIRQQLFNSLIKGGFSKEDAESKLPGCQILSEAASRINNRVPWAQCVNYEAQNEAFTSRCITQFIVTKFGNAEKHLTGATCETYRKYLKEAVMSATEDNQLPANWKQHSCDKDWHLYRDILQRESVINLCGRQNLHVSREKKIRDCLVEAKVNVDPLNCDELKQEFSAIMKSIIGFANPQPIRVDCKQLLHTVKINSDAYKEEERLKYEAEQKAESEYYSAISKQVEAGEKLHLEKVKSLPRTLDSLEIVVADDRKRIANKPKDYYGGFYSRFHARVDLLNDVAKPLIALINKQTSRPELDAITKRYRFDDDWQIKKTNPEILKSYVAKRDSFGPFQKLQNKDYLNAIYWKDIDYLRQKDRKILGRLENHLIRQNHFGNNLTSLMGDVATAFGANVPDQKKSRIEAFHLTQTFLKTIANTYLSNYQDKFHSCLRSNHTTYTHVIPAEDTIIYKNAYGIEQSRINGSPEIRHKYKINNEFAQLAYLIDVEKISPNTYSNTNKFFGIAKMLGVQNSDNFEPALNSLNQTRITVLKMMDSYQCNSEIIKTFETSLVDSFREYFQSIYIPLNL